MKKMKCRERERERERERGELGGSHLEEEKEGQPRFDKNAPMLLPFSLFQACSVINTISLISYLVFQT